PLAGSGRQLRFRPPTIAAVQSRPLACTGGGCPGPGRAWVPAFAGMTEPSGPRPGWAVVFKKILLANRGEIACRIVRTAHRMGMATVAVYSDADTDALHVRMADEAIRIGPAPSAESYLDIGRIIDACRVSGA